MSEVQSASHGCSGSTDPGAAALGHRTLRPRGEGLAHAQEAQLDRLLRPTRAPDRLELSDRAWRLGLTAAGADVRGGLVARVQSELAAGTYETPARIDGALRALTEALDLIA